MLQKDFKKVMDPTLDAFYVEVIDTENFRRAMNAIALWSDEQLQRQLSAAVLYVSEGGDGELKLPINITQLIGLFYEVYAWRRGHGGLLRKQD